MLPNHYLQSRLDIGKNTIGYFAREPEGRLIVFIHGFCGHAISTWRRMRELIVLESAAAGCDLIFFGYDSRRHRAMIHAGTFRDFLEELTTPNSPLRLQLPAARQGLQTPYERIVIAAHSLGVPVARQALLMGHRDQCSWAKVSRIVCFAPAHRGASIQKLARMAAGEGLGAVFYAFGLARNPVLQDLHPDDSAFLKDLRNGHFSHMPDPPGPPLRAHSVIFGDDDKIAEILEFHDSEPFLRWPGHDHNSLCKVDSDFRDPLELVMRALL